MPGTSLLLMWMSLPGGIDATAIPAQARLSVLLSPRVTMAGDAAATLADVPDLLAWPQTAAGLTFAVEADGLAQPIPAVVASGPLDLTLWQALFPPATQVESRTFDQDGLLTRPIQTYSQSEVVRQLQGHYSQVFANSPVTPPTYSEMLQASPDLAAALHGDPAPVPAPDEIQHLEPDAAQQVHEALVADLLRHAKQGTLAEALAAARDLAIHRGSDGVPQQLLPDVGSAAEMGRLLAFHTPIPAAHRPMPQAARPPIPQIPIPPPPVPPPPPPSGFAPEFHSILSTLHDYPALLRRLGLAVDVLIPAAALPDVPLSATTPVRLRVTVSGGALTGSTTFFSPWTAYIRDANGVFAAMASTPASPEIQAGLLNLAHLDPSGSATYSLLQVDQDGTAIKNLNSAANGPSNPDDGALPAVRSTGLSLIRAGQGTALQQRMTAANSNEEAAFATDPPTPVTLFAEDLTRGYRIDVRDGSGSPWRSLHQRTGQYSVPSLPVLSVTDEGTAQPSGLLDAADPQQANVLRVHESLARWEGWSLSVTLPGATVGDSGPEQVVSQPLPDGVQLTASFQVVPGTLPRLRFGHQYQVRARAVDLSGGGPTVDEASALQDLLAELQLPVPVLPSATTLTTYQRFEPIAAPVTVARERFTEGESVSRLVVRSSRTESSVQIAARLMSLVNAAQPADPVLYLGIAERHLAPPKSSQRMAERAGMLDGLPPDASYSLSRKEKGQLTDDFVIDVSTGLPVPLPAVPDPLAGGTRPAVELVGSGSSSYPLHHEDAMTLPYLPDPLATGVMLCGLPGVPPDFQAQIASDGTLVISPADLDSATLAAVGSLASISYGGTWPLLAPFRLQLTDGDGPPSWDPVARVLTVHLPNGRTATVRLSSLLPDGAVAMLGQWQWLVQSQAPSASIVEAAGLGLAWLLTPFREIILVNACQQPVLDPVLQSLTASRQPGGTSAALAGSITLDAASTAKVDLLATWTDQIDNPAQPVVTEVTGAAHVFEVALPPDPAFGTLTAGTGGAPDVLDLGPGQAPPPPPPHPPPGPPPGPHPSVAVASGVRSKQEFGDTRYRSVTYQCVATTAFQEYFPRQVGIGDITASGPSVTVDVPSTAVPPAPVIREAVPGYRWDRPADLTLPRRRYAAGVRLILERPWFATGDGEQVAVVLMDPASYPPSASDRPHVTHWGVDPAWGGGSLPGAPTPASFPAGGPAVRVAMPDLGMATLVPHGVQFDESRNAWICDIPVDAGGGYAPFIRLAVVRYQPHSLLGLAVSRVVVAPFVQVLPERQVFFTPPTADAPDTYGVLVAGITYSASALPAPPDPSGDGVVDIQGIDPPPDLIEVSVQQQLPGTTDDAGWRTADASLPIAVTVNSAVSGQGLPGAALDTPLWSGSVTLPPGRQPGEFRILVAERELLLSDHQKEYSYVEIEGPPDIQATEGTPGIQQPPHKAVITSFYPPGTQRLVFAETLLI
jgi:hypothetical protein